MDYQKKILRLPIVKNRVGRSRSGIYLMMSQGLFPKPISLGGRSVGWLENEIEKWIEEQIEATRGRKGDQA